MSRRAYRIWFETAGLRAGLSTRPVGVDALLLGFGNDAERQSSVERNGVDLNV
jgi:hypothetical protein